MAVQQKRLAVVASLSIRDLDGCGQQNADYARPIKSGENAAPINYGLRPWDCQGTARRWPGLARPPAAGPEYRPVSWDSSSSAVPSCSVTVSWSSRRSRGFLRNRSRHPGRDRSESAAAGAAPGAATSESMTSTGRSAMPGMRMVAPSGPQALGTSCRQKVTPQPLGPSGPR